MAVCLGELPPHPIAAPDEFQESFPEPLRGRLPLLVRLREFWESLPPSAGGEELTWAELEHVLSQWIARKNFDGLSWPIVRDHLAAGSALLIFDGVDEVPLSAGGPSRPAQPRAMLLAGLADAVKHWTAAGNRVLVTSRPYGLNDAQRQRLALPHAPLAELPRPLQELLVRRWFHCLRTSEGEAEAACGELWTDIASRPEIVELAANPLLLTAMCIVYGESHRLPQHEFDLYDRIVDTVLFNRYPQQSSQAAAARSRLCVIAHGMHTGEEQAPADPREQPRPEATVDEIDRMLQHYQDHRPGSELHKLSARDAREDLLSQSGLLLPQGDLRAGFYHFTFQDFLTAERLYDLHAADLPDIFRRRGPFEEWRKALGLLYGALLHKRSTPDQAIRLLEELLGGLPSEPIRLAVVLGDCLRILHGHEQKVAADAQRRFIDFCVAAVERETPLKQRVDLALALGRLGDPRVPEDFADPNAWVTVPADSYPVGSEQVRKEVEKENSWWKNGALPDQTFEVAAPFQISKYPVTNGQYAKFIAAGGYENDKFWSTPGWQWRTEQNFTEPSYWHDPKWNGRTQPVVGVSWWEAEAFCNWLTQSATLARSASKGFHDSADPPLLARRANVDDGVHPTFRLPTEREWEAAARGPDGRVYPWDGVWQPGICNSNELGLGVTTPVGIFPASASFCGAHDMAGNVWEWCADAYDRNKAKDPNAVRVLRGGSWLYYPRYCRAAFRSNGLPGFRFNDVGFRLSRT